MNIYRYVFKTGEIKELHSAVTMQIGEIDCEFENLFRVTEIKIETYMVYILIQL